MNLDTSRFSLNLYATIYKEKVLSGRNMFLAWTLASPSTRPGLSELAAASVAGCRFLDSSF